MMSRMDLDAHFRSSRAVDIGCIRAVPFLYSPVFVKVYSTIHVLESRNNRRGYLSLPQLLGESGDQTISTAAE